MCLLSLWMGWGSLICSYESLMLKKSSSLDTTVIGIPWPPSPVVCEIYTLLVFSTSFCPGFYLNSYGSHIGMSWTKNNLFDFLRVSYFQISLKTATIHLYNRCLVAFPLKRLVCERQECLAIAQEESLQIILTSWQ